MIIGVVALVIALAVPATGGSFEQLGRLRVRGWPLLPLALLLQVLTFSIFPGMPTALAVFAHLLTYVMAAAFLWLNRAVRGMPLIGLGAALNGVTIALNGGTLPASEWAVRTAGWDPAEGFANSGVLENPRLLWLGDVFAVPEAVPLANVFSIGDVLILVGVGVLILAGSRVREPVESSS